MQYSHVKVLIDGLKNTIYINKSESDSLVPIKVLFDIDACSSQFSRVTDNNSFINIQITMPLSIGISLTNRCNLKCNYCSFNSHKQGNELSFLQIKTFVNWFLKNCIIRNKANILNTTPKIYFAGGGEPTYNWRLFKESVEYIRNIFSLHGLSVHLGITTNGVLNDNQLDFLKTNFDSIMVSYDGICEIQNKNRISQNYLNTHDYVYRTLKNLDSNKINYSIRTTIWPEDYYLLSKMASYISEEFPNHRSWDVEPVMPEGRAENQTNNLVNYVNAFVLLEKYVFENQIPVALRSSAFKHFICCDNCGAAYGNNPWLDASGKILNCLDDHNHNTVLGKISNNELILYNFQDVIASQHYLNYHEICKNCIAFLHCGGGCPIRATENPLLNIQQCECKQLYWKQYYERLVKEKRYNNHLLKQIYDCSEYSMYEIIQQK